MGFFTLEHSTAAYRADFAISGIAVGGLSIFLLTQAPRPEGLELLAVVAAGLLSWSLLEYLIHRFLLHGVEPFRRWHGEHHRRPGALIYTPTVLVAATIFSFVFLPALWLGGLWRACALTLGVLMGNLAYAITHHATHTGGRRAPG